MMLIILVGSVRASVQYGDGCTYPEGDGIDNPLEDISDDTAYVHLLDMTEEDEMRLYELMEELEEVVDEYGFLDDRARAIMDEIWEIQESISTVQQNFHDSNRDVARYSQSFQEGKPVYINFYYECEGDELEDDEQDLIGFSPTEESANFINLSMVGSPTLNEDWDDLVTVMIRVDFLTCSENIPEGVTPSFEITAIDEEGGLLHTSIIEFAGTIEPSETELERRQEVAEKQQELAEKQTEMEDLEEEVERINLYNEIGNKDFGELCELIDSAETESLKNLYTIMWFKFNLPYMYDVALEFVRLPPGAESIESVRMRGDYTTLDGGFALLEEQYLIGFSPDGLINRMQTSERASLALKNLYQYKQTFNTRIDGWHGRTSSEWESELTGSDSMGEKNFISAWYAWRNGTINGPRFLQRLSLIVTQQSLESRRNLSADRIPGIMEQIEQLEEEIQQLESEIRRLEEMVTYAYDGGSEVEAFVFTSALRDWIFYSDEAQNYDEDTTSLMPKVNVVLTIITNIGMVVSVLMSAFMGIKYMLGSVEEQVELKKDLIPYLVGAILLFGISAIVKVMLEIGQSINNA